MYRKKKVAAYCRVSTDQSDQLHSLAAQRQFFEEFIKEHSDWELIEVYYDEGITGTSTKHREGFNKMIADCEKGLIETLLTKEVSRFARNTVDTLNYTRKLNERNINVIFMNDGIDTNDKDGELRLTIMASLAQEESRKTSERVKWGMRRCMEKGYVWGNGRLLGFTIKDGKLYIVPEEAELVRRIFHEYVYNDKGTYSIARELNAEGYRATTGGLFRQDSIMTIISNPKYCGDLLQWRTHSTDFLTKHRVKTTENESPESSLILLENTHEGLISKELFELAQQKREQRSRQVKEKSRHSSRHWFSGKIVCGKCGAKFTNSSIARGYYSMHCTNRQVYGKTIRYEANGKRYGCDIPTTTEKVFIECLKYVLEYINTQRDDIITALRKDVEAVQQVTHTCDIAPLQEKITAIGKKKEKAIDLMIEGLITKEDLKNQTKKYEAEIAELEHKIYESKNIGDINCKQLNTLKEHISTLKSMEIDINDKEMYKELLDKIIAQDEGVMDIYLKLLPFGFRVKYRKEIIKGTRRNQMIVIDECVNI